MNKEMSVDEIESIVRNHENEDEAFEKMQESIGGLGFNAKKLPDGWTLIQPKGLLFPESMKELSRNE
ncbi:MAG: hypothetical protein AB2826_27400 [Candidatus Thiodiazotropha sp.]